MVIDLRAHIVSLVAVFLALGLGILIGISLIGGHAIARRQVIALQKEFQALKQQNALKSQQLAAQAAQLAQDHGFAAAVVPALTAGHLTGQTVAVVVTEPGYDPSALTSLLAQAGATVGPVVVVNSPSVGLRSATLGQGEAALGVHGFTSAALWTQIASDTALELTSPTTAPLVDWRALESDGLVKVTGISTGPVQDVVLVGGDPQGTEDPWITAFDVPLLDGLKQAKVTIVAGQTTPVTASAMPAYQAAGVSTVDDLDQPAGEVALVYALAGEPGNYGVGTDAHTLLPALTGP